MCSKRLDVTNSTGNLFYCYADRTAVCARSHYASRAVMCRVSLLHAGWPSGVLLYTLDVINIYRVSVSPYLLCV